MSHTKKKTLEMTENLTMTTEEVRLANNETGPVATQVTDPNKLKILRNIVLGFWPRRRNDYFPGPQPVSLERRDLFKLKKYSYLACVKSDGMRFMMLCTTMDDHNKCYMVDRAFRFYEVDQSFDKTIYSNTLFDGELVKLKNRVDKDDNPITTWTYVIHDCVAFRGTDVSQMSFDKRYSYVTTAVETFWDIVSDSKVFPIEMKKFVPFGELGKLVELEKNGDISHNTDGLIFTPVDIPIGTNAQYTLFKWKSSHTFDFKICEEDGKYIAYVNQKGNLSAFASVSKQTSQGIDFGNKLSNLDSPKFESGMVVECEYNKKTQCFDPLFVRTDKTHPNGIYTVEKTLLNVQEDITLDELVNLKKE